MAAKTTNDPTGDIIGKMFYEAIAAMGRVHGSPLPKGLLTLGDKDDGWFVELNSTGETIDTVPRYECRVRYNGWPFGPFNAFGGLIGAGAKANEDALIAWLQAQEGE